MSYLQPGEVEGRLAVAGAHGTTTAAAWFGVSRQTMGVWLSNHGAGMAAHRPTNEALKRRAPRPLCSCPMCDAVRRDAIPEHFTEYLEAITAPAEPDKATGESWMRFAACRGPQRTLFYGPGIFERVDDRREREAAAKAICAECPCRKACLEYALALRDPFGVWGGATESERKAMGRSIAV